MSIPEPLFRIVLAYLRPGWVVRDMRQDVLRESTPFAILTSWMRDRHTCACDELTHDDSETSVCTLECGHIVHQRCMIPGSASGMVMCARCGADQSMTPSYDELNNTTFPFHLLVPDATTVIIDNGLVKYNRSGYTLFQSLEGEFHFDEFPSTVGGLIHGPATLMDAARQRSIRRGLRNPSLRHRQPCASDWEEAFQKGLIFIQLRVDAQLASNVPTYTFGPFSLMQCEPSRGSTKPLTLINLYVEDGRIYV